MRPERRRAPARGRPRSRAPVGPGGEADAAAVVACLRLLFQSIHEYSKAIHRQVRLSGPQVWALSLLDAESELSLVELSRRMFAHASTVSGIVERLVERGAVRRRVDHRDRRGVRLSLTARGRRLVRDSPPPVQVGLRLALSEMSPGRLRQLRRSLEVMVRRTRADRPVASRRPAPGSPSGASSARWA